MNEQELNIYKDQHEIIKDMAEIIKIQNAQSKEDRKNYFKYMKIIAVVLIIGLLVIFTVCTCFFYKLYFSSNFSDEIREQNTYTTNSNTTNKEIKENYNYSENK